MVVQIEIHDMLDSFEIYPIPIRNLGRVNFN